ASVGAMRDVVLSADGTDARSAEAWDAGDASVGSRYLYVRSSAVRVTDLRHERTRCAWKTASRGDAFDPTGSLGSAGLRHQRRCIRCRRVLSGGEVASPRLAHGRPR